jgi:hypothetical protein
VLYTEVPTTTFTKGDMCFELLFCRERALKLARCITKKNHASCLWQKIWASYTHNLKCLQLSEMCSRR